MPYPHPFTENVQLNALSFHLFFFLGNGASRGFQGNPYRPVNTYRQAHSYGPAHPMPSHSNTRYRPPFPINSPS